MSALRSPIVVIDAPAELELTPINGDTTTLQQWLTTFHLVLVILDPYTNESAWLLPTVARTLRVYSDADCRVGLLTTSSAEEARQFLGPYAQEFLTFADPDRSVAKGLGLSKLPAIVHIRQDLSIAGFAEGWDPPEWRKVTEALSESMQWSKPVIPGPRDPAPFAGSPARI
ncbi:MAG: hypothetical protein ACSLFB_03745 [Acidimicrobiales bacterium]